MHEPKNYGVLRDAQQTAATEHGFDRPDAEMSTRPAEEKPPELALTQQEQSPDQPFMSDLDKYELDRAALVKELDEKVQSGKIDRHESYYQLTRFENSVTPAQPAKEQAPENERSPVFRCFGEQDRSETESEKGQEREGTGASPSKGQSDTPALTFMMDQDLDRGR